MVFPVDRVQQRFQSRSLSFPIQVAVVKIFNQSRAPQRLPRISLDKLVKGFFALFPKIEKVRHNLRTRGRNCLRTRAHGRRRLMTCPWCLRRRRKRRRRSARRTLRWSTWSTTTVCGSASGSLLASGIAGGWPLLMGHRLVTPSGGRRGSLAEGQGEVGTTVDTWSASVPVLMPYVSSFYVKVNSDPKVVGLALWRVGNHAEWRSAHSRSFSFPCFRTWNLDNTL